MATPSSPAARSDTESRSSPTPHVDKSFAASVNPNMTEDEDNGYDHTSTVVRTKEASYLADSPQRTAKSGGGSRKSRGARDSSARFTPGANMPTLYKDPSVIGKIRHLKKEDGEPLWRVDIQYDFLRAIFDDDRHVFTNSYDDTLPKQCFADLYIDTMARSSKTSKILHDKLLSDREAAKNMAMVCLLVNIGRMNTTLNFFPEMRAQLRTYHAIPSLQVDESATDYKQLQDAPRLKSILKGGTEDRMEPRTLDDLKSLDVPRTNPVNLLFLICNNAVKVAELHFPPGFEFHDLIMRTTLTSKSRADAFLWVVWFYLESDFTEEGCDENPFGAGMDYGVDVANQGVPKMVELTPEEVKEENVDTPAEVEFGLQRKAFRAKILNNEAFPDAPGFKRTSRPSRPSGAASQTAAAAKDDAAAAKESAEPVTDTERSSAPNILPRIRPSKHESDMESVRSTPPPRSIARASAAAAAGIATSSSSRRAGPYKSQLADGASPARQPPLLQQLYQQQQLQLSRKKRKPQKAGERALDDDDDDDRGNTSIAPSRKPRPPTAHQIAVENNRKQRIEYLLSRGMHRKQHRARKARRIEGAIIRAQRRLDEIPDPFEDSESEDNLLFNRNLFGPHPGAPQNMPSGTAFRERGFFGLVQLSEEIEDYGEEFEIYATAIRRSCRRINRWESDPNHAVVPTIKRPRVNVPLEDEYKDPNETEEEDDMDKMDDDMSMSILETTPAPSASKRRRATGTGASGRARGSRLPRSRATGTGGVSSSTIRRRAAAAAKAEAAAKAAAEAEANGDVTMDDADDGETALVSGAEDHDGGGDETDAAASTSGAVKPRVTIMKMKPRSRAAPALLSRGSNKGIQVKHEDDDDEDDDDGDDDDELNDLDKTLLGMGDGDTDSE